MKEFVTCLICNVDMKCISWRHLKSHGLTVCDYKIKFPDASTVSEASAARLTERSIKSNVHRKGVKRTAVEIENMKTGIINSGRKPRTGWNMTDEQKKKLSDAAHQRHKENPDKLKGRIVPEERRIRISETLKKYEPTPQHKENIRVGQEKRRGTPSKLKGIYIHSVESRRKISETNKIRLSNQRVHTREYMIERINLSNLILLNDITDDIFSFKCKTCSHAFTRTPQCFQDSKWKKDICDQCFPISPVSNAEIEVTAFIKSIYHGSVLTSDMETIAPLELDIHLPDLKLAFEYCGLYWHSELVGKNRFYHRKKYDLCVEKGIKLITIFEDEWVNKRSLVESMISNALNHNTIKIHARKTKVIALTTEIANAFLKENHIQGRGRSNAKYGLEYNGELISVMTFSNNDLSRNSVGWDMNRFCSKIGCNISGGASKLFSAFVKEHDPEKVVSYADLRWGNGKVYSHLGFEFVGNTVPNYWYFKNGKMLRYHRYGQRKRPEEPKDKTEWDLRQEEGWNRIWDCGHAKWVWIK